MWGQRAHWSFRLGKLKQDRSYKAVEMVLGAVPALLSGLALTWLLGVAIGRPAVRGVQQQRE